MAIDNNPASILYGRIKLRSRSRAQNLSIGLREKQKEIISKYSIDNELSIGTIVKDNYLELQRVGVINQLFNNNIYGVEYINGYKREKESNLVSFQGKASQQIKTLQEKILQEFAEASKNYQPGDAVCSAKGEMGVITQLNVAGPWATVFLEDGRSMVMHESHFDVIR